MTRSCLTTTCASGKGIWAHRAKTSTATCSAPCGRSASFCAFRALVDEAKAEVDAAKVGDKPGQWTQKEINLITAAIADAEKLLAKTPISQYDFDLGVAAFRKAYKRFCSNVNAEVKIEVVEIDALIEDAENWTPYKENKAGKPNFKGGKLTLTATSANQTACYTGSTYKNKIFRFDYQQTYAAGNDNWGGFYFNMGDAADIPYSQKCILVVAKSNQTELQVYDSVNKLVTRVSKFAFESGKTYRVEFGLYDVNATDVRAVLKVNGVEILSYTAEDNKYLYSAEGRFGVMSASNGMNVTLGSVGTKLTIDSLIEDEENWKTSDGSAAPKFIADKMVLDGPTDTGYVGEKFTNRVLHFEYTGTFSENAWSGLYFNNGSTAVQPETGTGILARIYSDKVELKVYENGTCTQTLTNTKNLLQSGKTYRMTFGMYDIQTLCWPIPQDISTSVHAMRHPRRSKRPARSLFPNPNPDPIPNPPILWSTKRICWQIRKTGRSAMTARRLQAAASQQKRRRTSRSAAIISR